MTASVNEAIQPVLKSITVNATPEEAFRVFTEDFDSWNTSRRSATVFAARSSSD